jgi:plastocyanin
LSAVTGRAWLRLGLLSLLLVSAAACGSSNNGAGQTTNPGTPLELNSGDFGTGGIYSHRFSTAGTYAYHCVHHSPMTGSVVVNASATDTLATVSITSDTSPFAPASVKPGGRVVWTNNTGMVHTVTSQ